MQISFSASQRLQSQDFKTYNRPLISYTQLQSKDLVSFGNSNQGYQLIIAPNSPKPKKLEPLIQKSMTQILKNDFSPQLKQFIEKNNLRIVIAQNKKDWLNGFSSLEEIYTDKEHL